MYPIDFFYRSVSRVPNNTAIETFDTHVTYIELAEQVNQAAAALIALDDTLGSRVCICGYNSPSHLIAWLAVLAAGKVWVPLYPANGREELQQSASWAGASIVLAAEDMVEVFEGLDAPVFCLEEWISATGRQSLASRPAWSTHEPPDLSATQAIKFTGGTTGKPKGVKQPYRAWNTNIVTQLATYGFDEGMRYLTAAPITHGTSTYILPTLAVGGTLVLTDRPRPADLLKIIASKRITTVFVPPTVIYMMLDETRRQPVKLPKLQHLIYGAAPMQPDAIDEALAVFGPVLHSTYGQTEAPQIATHIKPEELAQLALRNSVGRPTLLTSVAILDGDEVSGAPGVEGEIVIRGDLLMTGYWQEEEKTTAAFHHGWLKTGDIGLFDNRGYLFIKGRSKEVIITGGFNVYPSDVEPILGLHPAVRDAAVFGVPDSKWGEAVHAVVELNSGQEAAPEALIAFVREKLGPVKTPKSIQIWERVPRNPFGKVNKQVLVNEYLNKDN